MSRIRAISLMTVFLTDSLFNTFLNRKAKVIDCRNPDVSDIQKLKTLILCKYLYKWWSWQSLVWTLYVGQGCRWCCGNKQFVKLIQLTLSGLPSGASTIKGEWSFTLSFVFLSVHLATVKQKFAQTNCASTDDKHESLVRQLPLNP